MRGFAVPPACHRGEAAAGLAGNWSVPGSPGSTGTTVANRTPSPRVALSPSERGAAQAKALLAGVRPRDEVGKTRRRIAAELVADLERVYQRKKATNRELLALLKATGTTLTQLNGIGPSAAARLLVEVGDISRFPDRNHFASWNGTAPIDASSSEHTRQRLSRAGNRQINRAMHIMAIVQLRNPTEGRAYYDRRKAAREDLHGSHAQPHAGSPTSGIAPCSTAPSLLERAREGNGATTLTPARLA